MYLKTSGDPRVAETLNFFVPSDNFYGTPKPPAEPSALLLNVTDQLLPGARPSSEGKRKRNKSVSNMEKAGIEPPEEEEEEKPIVNGNGVAITPGQPPPTARLHRHRGRKVGWEQVVVPAQRQTQQTSQF